jgi:hypothetical protein
MKLELDTAIAKRVSPAFITPILHSVRPSSQQTNYPWCMMHTQNPEPWILNPHTPMIMRTCIYLSHIPMMHVHTWYAHPHYTPNVSETVIFFSQYEQ